MPVVTATQHRVPPGVPTGGRFSPTVRSEPADVALVPAQGAVRTDDFGMAGPGDIAERDVYTAATDALPDGTFETVELWHGVERVGDHYRVVSRRRTTVHAEELDPAGSDVRVVESLHRDASSWATLADASSWALSMGQRRYVPDGDGEQLDVGEPVGWSTSASDPPF